jgi:uncharacterized membrane protein YfcA
VTEELIIAGAILLLGAVVQSSAGFGAGLVAIPLLLLLGFPLPFAVPFLAGAAIGQCGLGLYQHREEIELRLSLKVALAQWVAMPLGVWVMTAFWMDRMDLTRQAVGALILVLLVAQRFFKPTPRDSRSLLVALSAGGGAGFLSGALGMGGPPLVFFALAHSWSATRFRTFLWTQILLSIPVLLLILSLRAGPSVLEAFALGLLGIPVMAIGSEVGRRATRGWKSAHVRRAANTLLGLLAMSALLSPLL